MFFLFLLLFVLFPEIPKPVLTSIPSWEDVFQNEYVQLFCDDDSSEWSFVWYRNGEQLQKHDHWEWAEDDPILNITAAKESEGEYWCSLTENSRRLHSQKSNIARIKVLGNLAIAHSNFTRFSNFGDFPLIMSLQS